MSDDGMNPPHLIETDESSSGMLPPGSVAAKMRILKERYNFLNSKIDNLQEENKRYKWVVSDFEAAIEKVRRDAQQELFTTVERFMEYVDSLTSRINAQQEIFATNTRLMEHIDSLNAKLDAQQANLATHEALLKQIDALKARINKLEPPANAGRGGYNG